MYRSDQNTPAIAYGETNLAYLDVTNPHVRRYFLGLLLRALAGGYRGIAFDNGIAYNRGKATGHFDGTGRWVPQYSGVRVDPTFAAAQYAAFNGIVAALKASYPHLNVTVNQRFECNPEWRGVLQSANMVLDESPAPPTTSPSDGCSDYWLSRMVEYRYIQQVLGKGLVLDYGQPYADLPYSAPATTRARAALQRDLADYLLIKYRHTYFFWAGPKYLWPYEHVPIGTPREDFYGSQGVYMRDYTNGLAISNPSPSREYTIVLPTGKYVDLNGVPVNTKLMAPDSGLVLLRRPSGA
jgi:hypothetical protein